MKWNNNLIENEKPKKLTDEAARAQLHNAALTTSQIYEVNKQVRDIIAHFHHNEIGRACESEIRA